MEELVNLISHSFDLSTEDVKPDTNMRDLTEDSLDFIELIISIEDQFDVDIMDNDINDLITVQDVVNYINKQSSQCGAI